MVENPPSKDVKGLAERLIPIHPVDQNWFIQINEML